MCTPSKFCAKFEPHVQTGEFNAIPTHQQPVWSWFYLQGVGDGQSHKAWTQTVSGYNCKQSRKRHDAVPYKLQADGQPPARTDHQHVNQVKESSVQLYNVPEEKT